MPDIGDTAAGKSVANLAKDQALKGFGTGTGSVNTPANVPGGTPSAQCGTGTADGAATPATGDPASTMGPTTAAKGGLSGNLNGVHPSVQNMVRNSVPSGCNAQVTPNGGVGSRKVGNSAHPRGLATDTTLYCGGVKQGMGSPQLNQYVYNLNQNGARGLAVYRQGFVHSDLMGTRQRRWSTDGADAAYTNAAAGGKDPGPGAAQAAQGPGGAQGGDPCAGGSGGGGCQPVQSSAPQNAAALANNQGLAMPTSISDLASTMASGSPLAGAMQQATAAVQGAIGSALGPLAGAIPLSPAALTDPAGAITKLVADKVGGMASGIAPGIVGNMASSILSGSGMGQGQLSGIIQNTAGQIFSQATGGMPQLDKFISIFNAANGAQGFAGALQQTIGNTMNNVFGNAGDLFQNLSQNNWANIPGFTAENNPYNTLNGAYMGEVQDAVASTIGRSQFIGQPKDVLNTVVNKETFNAFSSMFADWDSYVTRGYGTITNDVKSLGTDFKSLGKLIDLNDMMRIGTPGHIAQQIILNGAGANSGLLDFLAENKLRFADLSNSQNDQLVGDYLYDVSDVDTIDHVKNMLGIDSNLELESLGDLLDTSKILPNSYDYNYFENINDIAIFLGMCNGSGQIPTIGELGKLLETFEVLFNSDKLAGEPAIYNYNDITNFANEYAPIGYFTADGTLSIADFIGTAAGYIHDVTIPRIIELQNDLYNNTNYFDDYLALVELLTNTANGNYYVPEVPAVPPSTPAIPAYVNVPSVAGYTFGTYTTLDDAISDIVDAIEYDLQYTKDNITEDDVNFKLLELESLHTESSMQLAREHKLRKAYGMKLGSPKKSDQFIGDGSTRALPLTVDIDDDEEINVFVSGVWQSPNSYTVNYDTNVITLGTAPSIGTLIAVNYKTDAFTGVANKMQVWDFASNLENYALDTGFGRSADFLRRIVSDDVAGQRIAATLMNARNKARSEEAGLNCPNFETVNGSAPSYINYINWTGVWTTDQDRAAEVWLQNGQDVNTTEQYLVQKMEQNKKLIEPEIEVFTSNITRQLIFYNNGNLAISDLMAELYQANSNSEIYSPERDDLFIGYSEDLPTEGYILGPYKEMLSAITSKEGIKNSVFIDPLSSSTEKYLKSINLELNMLVTIIQRILIVNVSRYLGIGEADFREIFGVQSVSKAIMYNIANNY